MRTTEETLSDLALLKSFSVDILFYRKSWDDATFGQLLWVKTSFPPTPPRTIPKTSGVYVFVVDPDIFHFEQATGLFYVGKATNLYSRISTYKSEINKEFKKSNRPLIWNMINKWNGKLNCYYTVTNGVEEAEVLENKMINAYRPPFNRAYQADTSQFMRAFP